MEKTLIIPYRSGKANNGKILIEISMYDAFQSAKSTALIN